MFYFLVSQKEKQDYGRKVDIYAVGLIYFELLWQVGTRSERYEVGEIIHLICKFSVPNDYKIIYKVKLKKVFYIVIFSCLMVYGISSFQKDSLKSLTLK